MKCSEVGAKTLRVALRPREQVHTLVIGCRALGHGRSDRELLLVSDCRTRVHSSDHNAENDDTQRPSAKRRDTRRWKKTQDAQGTRRHSRQLSCSTRTCCGKLDLGSPVDWSSVGSAAPPQPSSYSIHRIPASPADCGSRVTHHRQPAGHVSRAAIGSLRLRCLVGHGAVGLCDVQVQETQV